MTHRLVKALVGMVAYVTSQRCRRVGNHYTQAPVVEALKAIGEATGQPTDGYNFLDVIDNLKEKEKAGK